MADRIKGITIELNGSTQKLQDSLSDVNSKIKDTQANLKDVNKLLKLDPSNTELLKQKQALLKDAVKETKDKLDQEKEALKALESAGNSDATQEAQQKLRREIEDTTLSLKEYQKELSAANPTLNQIHEISGQVSEKTKGLSMAAAGGAAGMLGMAVQAGKTADDLNTLSKQYGVSTAEIQKMNYAQDLIDVSTQDMLGSMAKLTKQMGSGSDVFDQLGVSITDANGNMRDSTDVWYDTLEALSQVTNETERDIYAQELFGKSASSLAGIIDDGGAALKEMGKQAEDAGLILSQDALDSANQFNDALDTLKGTATQSFMEAGAALAEELIPALEGICKIVENVLKWWGDLDGSVQIGILTVLGLIAAISPVAGIISTISGVAMALNVTMLPLIGTIAAVIAIIAAVIAIGVALYENWDVIKAKAIELKDRAVEAFNSLKEKISEKIQQIKDKCVEIGNKIKDVVTSIKDGIKEKIQAIKETLSGMRDHVKEIFNSIKDGIKDKIEAARDTVKNAIEKIKGFFNFKWELPKLKLPHFSMSGGFSLMPPSVPHIEVDWHAKAMKDGMILNSPTIFGMKGNKLLAGGEAGSETVVGTASLMSMISKAAAAGGPNITMNVYGAQGQDVNQLADIVTQRLTKTLQRRTDTWRL